ncbi:hypothetical protein GCM10010923_10120 [Blastomonas marina]|jgi:hypothetical protein|uniref:MarR family transcriptional regulator n=1 Tax=Blastomonas marina TaxID=1867408 RepID=A0ABQ1F8A2_9SPHN|nr:hypothetical protein [Blastomonas marina]GGA03250.1 hypothetical protein GCM10010923_10120 [Blastomonas marina]
MATDDDIEQFICDSFSSIWDLELLSTVIAMPEEGLTAAELVERMRASELVVEQGVSSLVAAGIASLDRDGRLQFRPVSTDLEACARRASEFYQRFPGRARRLMIARQSPGLNAFADAFRLRKD